MAVCLLDTSMIPAKSAEQIEMQFGLWTRVGPRNHVLGWSPASLGGRGNFEGYSVPLEMHCTQLELRKRRYISLQYKDIINYTHLQTEFSLSNIRI